MTTENNTATTNTNTKLIQFSSSPLSGGSDTGAGDGRKTRRRRRTKAAPAASNGEPLLTPTQLKRHLMNRLAEHKKHLDGVDGYGTGTGAGEKKGEENRGNEFTESLQYLASLAKAPPPPYGVLKGGTKPTYRTWLQQTQRASAPPVANEVIQREQRVAALRERAMKKQLEASEATELAPVNVVATEVPAELSAIPAPIPEVNSGGIKKQIITKTIRRKYRLGKNGQNQTVSVLVLDQKARKEAADKHRTIRNTPMLEVREYLRKHNLIKAGSNAPNHILRQMYENAILSGNIMNTNSEIMLHNLITT